MRSAVVVAALRTPFARLDGELAATDAQALAAAVVGALARRAGDVAPVADVILASAAGPGGNLARRAALDAGLGAGVPGITLDRQCGGGLDAVVLACRLVQAGAGDLFIAGGVEHASGSPLRVGDGRDLRGDGTRFFPRMPFSGGGLDDPGMAESAEIIAERMGITRARQDALAAESHRRACAAPATAELVPVHVGAGVVDRDTCPRPRLDAARMARFPPLLHPGGTVTAGNASQIADGAAAVLVASAAVAARLGGAGLRFVDAATTGVDPRVCGLGAVEAARMLRQRTPACDPATAGHVAMTEAFAAQVLATQDALGLDPARVNPDGGAIALGHPWGASGAMQVVRLFHRPARDGSVALAAIAGGMGTAAWFGAA